MEIFKRFFNQQPLWDHLYSVSYFSGSKRQGKASCFSGAFVLIKSLPLSLQSLYFPHNKLWSFYNIDSVKLPNATPLSLPTTPASAGTVLPWRKLRVSQLYLSDKFPEEQEQRASHAWAGSFGTQSWQVRNPTYKLEDSNFFQHFILWTPNKDPIILLSILSEFYANLIMSPKLYP